MDALTIEQIRTLPFSINDPDGDYLAVSPEEQERIVALLVKDNSKVDPTTLYMAANTAYRIHKIKEAGFLFYAARIRGYFDAKRFCFNPIDVENIGVYWESQSYIFSSTGLLAMGSTRHCLFDIAKMIVSWEVIPSDGAVYPSGNYERFSMLPKDQWVAIAEEAKGLFKKNIQDNYKKFLSIPENAANFEFVRGYEAGTIPHTQENEQLYEGCVFMVCPWIDFAAEAATWISATQGDLAPEPAG